MSVRDIVKAIKSHRSTVGKVSKIDYTDRECLSVVITNLLRCVDNNDMLLYTRRKDRVDKWVQNPLGISNHRITKAIDWLADNMCVVNTIASTHQLLSDNKQTSYATTTTLFSRDFHTPTLAEKAKESALLNQTVLSIRDVDGCDIAYRQTKLTKCIEEDMRTMNSNNDMFVVLDGEGCVVNTPYSRVFKIDLSYNGRMYCHGVMGIENRDSKSRLKFTIDGEQVVEVDYSSMHLRMFADIYGVDVPSGDLYTWMLPEEMRNKANREVMKGVVNRVFNCPSHASAVASARACMAEVEGHTFQGPLQAVELMYSLLEDRKALLYQHMFGQALTNMESNVMSDVIAVFTMLKRCILTVHDSAIVVRSDRELLAKTMSSSYKKHMNVDKVIEMRYSMWCDGKEVKEDCSC